MGDQLWLQLSPTVESCIRRLTDGGVAQPSELASELGLPVEQVHAELRRLCDAGVAEFRGAAKGRVYIFYGLAEALLPPKR